MKKTFYERWTSQCMGIIERYPFSKIPVHGIRLLVLSTYSLCLHFWSNGKRYASLCMALLFFVVNGSFNFHDASFVHVEGEEVQLTSGSPSAKNQVELLEDEDVILEGFDDVILAGMDNIDTYSLEDILAENGGYLERNREELPSALQGIIFDKEDWRLILVNKLHPVPDDYDFPLGTIKGDLKCDERILEDLLDMMQAAKDENIDLLICSPYRDYNRQTVLFNKKIETYMKKGVSYLDAYKLSSKTVTLPNASEHQLGLAIDFYSSTYMKLNEGFSKTPTGIWLAENAYKYGFILRYPLGKEYITGIGFEPWHFRYVGVEAATVITESQITLEEFWEEYIE